MSQWTRECCPQHEEKVEKSHPREQKFLPNIFGKIIPVMFLEPKQPSMLRIQCLCLEFKTVKGLA